MTERKLTADRPIDHARILACASGISAALIQPGTLPHVLGRCVHAMAQHLDAALVRIWTLDAEHDVLQLQASTGTAAPPGDADDRIAVGEGDVGVIARERRPRLIDRVADDLGLRDGEWARREGIVGFAGHPLIAENRLVGVLALYAREPVSPVVAEAIPSLANTLALGVEQRRVEQTLREQAEIIKIVSRVGQILAAELDLQRLVQALTDAATEIAGARVGAFFEHVPDERGASFMLYSLSGVSRDAFANVPMPRATDLFGATFRGEGTLRIADVTKDPRYGNSSPYFGIPPGHLPVKSYLAVSVTSRSGKILGGLFFGHPEPGMFTARTERIVEHLSAQAAVAIDNARLYEAQRKALAQAEEASRLKDLFLATVSHELRAPLNAMLGWTYLMRTGQMGPEEMSRALETVERNARAQNQLIDDLLDVSSIISGKLRLDVRSVALGAVIEAALETVRLSAEAKNVRLQVVLDPAAGPVKGDPDRLQQVVWNLFSNAIKFTPKGGRVDIHLRRINSHIEIAVRDTGIGISPEFLPYVFDRFRQQESTSTRAHGGLGLGLAIVRHLVELHGGTVHADSAGRDQGATFTITLPVMAGVEATAAREHITTVGGVAAGDVPSIDGVRVLVVDDELSARQIVTAILTRGGADVQVAASAEEAMQSIEIRQPDVLVADIEMPGEDGYSLIRRVRRLDAASGGQIPAVALTAYARVQDRLRALSAGYQIHVPKPVEPVELLTVVASLTGRLRQTR